MDATILWEENRNLGQIGKDDASAKFTAYLLTDQDSMDKILIEGTFKVGHYRNYSETFEWNDAVNTAPVLTIEYTPFEERTKLIRRMIERADGWFARCDLFLIDARQLAEHAA